MSYDTDDRYDAYHASESYHDESERQDFLKYGSPTAWNEGERHGHVGIRMKNNRFAPGTTAYEAYEAGFEQGEKEYMMFEEPYFMDDSDWHGSY